MRERLCILSLAALAFAGCSHDRGVGASRSPDAHWSYEGATGPAHWGALSTAYSLCANGRSQSPIDVVSTEPADLVNLDLQYRPTPVEIVNNGHTIQVDYAPGSHMAVDGVRFELAQFHFHAPSEHTIGGQHAAAEMHLVHRSAAGELAVVGVLIEEGEHNAKFEPVWNHLPGQEGPAKRVAATIDADDLLPPDPRTYRYSGSLTTPPGTEGVRWHLMVEPVRLSRAQLDAFTRVCRGNNRPVQARNERRVLQDTTR